MSNIYIAQYSIDEIQFFLDFISSNISDYKLDELTNGHCGDVPTINKAHPLAIEYGASKSSDEDNFTSTLPAIGIEGINDVPAAQQVLGKGRETIEITQAMHDDWAAIAMKNRYKTGLILSDTNLTVIQAAITSAATAGDKLYGEIDQYFQQQSVNISMWSNHIDTTRILYLTIRAILMRAHKAAAVSNLKNLKIIGQEGLYNYDFEDTLYGAEFNLDMIATVSNIEIDTGLITIDNVDLYTKTGITENKDQAGVTGVGLSRSE